MAELSPRGASIAVLPDSVAKRIAAGEVIERPASVVRELLDNALDAGSATIDVEYSSGGIDHIRVVDDGSGMGADDLALCLLAHATSKIQTLDDLATAQTMGFRGEALPSIAAVADVEIRSRLHGTDGGNRVAVTAGNKTRVEPSACPPGTRVDVNRLFAEVPARRRFLSRPQSEAAQIRQAIMDKALAHEGVRFTMARDGGRRLVLPAAPRVERVARVFGDSVPAPALHALTGSGDGFSFTVVAASPDVARRDRRLIQVCVNRRRVWEYKLVHAIEHAYGEVLHGGLFPVAALFLAIDPALVDVNVHPAKREVRIRAVGEIHHRVAETLRSFLRAYLVQSVVVEGKLAFPRSGPDHSTGPYRPPATPPTPVASCGAASTGHTASGRVNVRVPGRPAVPFRSAADRQGPGDLVAEEPDAATALRFVGHLFDTFVIVADRHRAYIIDQHAAHERILYDRLRDARTSQKLLIEEVFETTGDEDRALQSHRAEFAELGVIIERTGERRWRLEAAPAEYRTNAAETIETILELGGLQGAWDREFVARMACKAAVKAGTSLDAGTSLELARRTLALPEPRCPHGRPLWVELDREALLRLIGRIT